MYLCDETILKTKDSNNTVTVTMGAIGTPSGLSNSSIDQTSFTANWSAVAGATSYTVEVRNISNNVVASETSSTNSKSFASLSPGASYTWSVKAHSSASNSPFSSSIGVTTIPNTPTPLSASNLQQQSFTARWNTVSGVSGYRLDVSTSSSFSTFVSGFNNLSVAATSTSVTGLTPGTTYYYRIRAVNATGTSPSSTNASAMTVPPNPVAIAASEVTQISFLARWNSSTGADDYRLDVSTDNFSTFLTGFNNVTVTGNSLTVGGLTFGETYQYRVRAVNGSGTSGHSNTQEVALTPAEPLTTPPSAIQTNQFDANWTAVTGASSYRLDVSSSNSFDTFVPGFNNKSVTGTTATVDGLNPGTSYFYRVRSVNDGGSSGNSNVTSTTTVSLAPLATSPLDVTQTSLTAKWNSVAGAIDYRLDVSLDNFASFVTGFNDAVVTGTSVAINGLASGQVYQYRVRASNAAGASANSNVVETLLKPANPALIGAAQVTQTSFDVSWNAVFGASAYQLDVASNEGFTNFVLGFQNKGTTATSDAVGGLSPGFTYFIRVRALNDTGTSGNSGVVQQITVPGVPAAIQVKEAFSNQFVASWPAVTGASFYDVEVSSNDAFTILLPGFPKKIEGQVEAAVQGLVPSTIYFVRVRSGNDYGVSGYSVAKAISTLNGDGSNSFEMTMDSPIFNSVFQPAGTTISINVTGGLPDRKVKFHHRSAIQGDYEVVEISSATSVYAVQVPVAWLDDLGMEFFFTAEDANQTKTSSVQLLRSGVTENSISNISFGGALKDYRIISVPYTLENSVIDNVFEPILGAYDKGKWRLVRYQGGRNVDYTEGLSKGKFDRGKGFWFNTLSEVTLSVPASAQNGDNTRTKPFQIVLEAGWNQIGNPFPFAIDWSLVQEFNPDIKVGDLLGYNPDKISLDVISQLNVFEGGFVFSDEPIAFEIPVTAKAGGSTGRKGITRGRQNSLTSWNVPINIQQGDMLNTLNGFGMATDALFEKDELDRPVAPRFIRYLEWQSISATGSIALSNDIVPLSDRQTWAFKLNQNGNGNITLTWDATLVPGSLILLDEKDGIVIDMRKANQYSFDGSERIFKVMYGVPFVAIDTPIKLGAPYPNPAVGRVTIPWALANDAQNSAWLRISSLTGTKVLETSLVSTGEGLQNFDWDLNATTGARVQPGLYIYELVNIQTGAKYNGRLIVK